MFRDAVKLIFIRTLAHWRLLLPVILGVLLASTIMATSEVYFQSLRDLALRDAFNSVEPRKADLLIEVSTVPTNEDTHKSMKNIVDSTNDRFGEYINDGFLAIKTWTFFVDLPLEKVHPSECSCRTAPVHITDDPDARIECDCRRANFVTLPGYDGIVTLTDGEYPGVSLPSRNDYQVNAMLDKSTANKVNLKVGDYYPVKPHWTNRYNNINVRISGLYERTDPEADIWHIFDGAFGNKSDTLVFSSFVVSEQTIINGIGKWIPDMGTEYAWLLDVAPEKIDSRDSVVIRSIINDMSRDMKPFIDGFILRSDLESILKTFETDLFFNRLPMIIVMSIIVLVVLYYVMVLSSLLIDAQKTEITLLRTRGATSLQILLVFIIEAIFILLAATILSPLLAVFGVSLLGLIYTDLNEGLLLPVDLTFKVFQMASFGALLSFIALLLPAYRVTKSVVITSRFSKSRPAKRNFLYKYYLDIGILFLSLFIFWQLSKQGSFVAVDIFGERAMNNLILAFPAIFMVSIGIVVLRIFPIMVGLTGRFLSLKFINKFVTPVIVIALWQMARNPAHYSRLSLLIILTAGLGVFASSFSSTLIQSGTDQVFYQSGSDIRIKSVSVRRGGFSFSLVDLLDDLAGINISMPVYRERGTATGLYTTDIVRVMGIDPDKYSDIGWTRPDFGVGRDGMYLPEITTNQINQGLLLPEGIRWLSLRIRTMVPDSDIYVLARLSDKNNRYFTVPLGSLTPDGSDRARFNCKAEQVYGEDWAEKFNTMAQEEKEQARNIRDKSTLTQFKWCRIGGSLTGLSLYTRDPGLIYEEPLRLHSIGVVSPQKDLKPSAFDIDDISVMTRDAKRLIIVEDFNSLDEWNIMIPTREAMGDNFSMVEKGIVRFRWASGESGEFRGFGFGHNQNNVFVFANTNFVDNFGGEIGVPIDILIRERPVKVIVKRIVDYFPTIESDDESFILMDLDSLHNLLNRTTVFGEKHPDEYWLNLDISDDNVDKITPSTSEKSNDAVVQEIENLLSKSRVKHGKILDRTSELSRISINPLITSGWRALLGISFLTVLTVTSVAFLVHSSVSFKMRLTELALLRTIGLSMKQLLFFVFIEQFFVIFVALVVGVFLGLQLGSTIMPYLANSGEVGEVVPPIRMLVNWGNFSVLFGLLGVVFTCVTIVTLISVYKMSINTVMRIGE